MLNIYELEKKWLKYKIKRYIPYFIILISLTVITIITFIILDEKNFNIEESKSIQENNIIQPAVTEKILDKKTDLVEKIEPNIEVTEVKTDVNYTESKNTNNKDIKDVTVKGVVLEPSLNFIQNISDDSRLHYKQKEVKQEIKKEIKQPKQIKENKSQDNPKVQPKQVEEIQKKDDTSIHIQKKDDYEDIKHVIKRFNKNNNPALSLFIAKKYYELGEYNQAYNYALRTNELNNNIEASWIIFSKSLVKLNKRDQAIKTLKQYINHSNSNNAKILLDEILSGKLHAN